MVFTASPSTGVSDLPSRCARPRRWCRRAGHDVWTARRRGRVVVDEPCRTGASCRRIGGFSARRRRRATSRVVTDPAHHCVASATPTPSSTTSARSAWPATCSCLLDEPVAFAQRGQHLHTQGGAPPVALEPVPHQPRLRLRRGATRRLPRGLLPLGRLHGAAPSGGRLHPQSRRTRAWTPLTARARSSAEPRRRPTRPPPVPGRSSSRTRRPPYPPTLNPQTPSDSTATGAPTGSARTSLPADQKLMADTPHALRPDSGFNRLSTTGRIRGVGGCDDEPPQADRGVRVRLPDPSGGCPGPHRRRPPRPGLLLHREGRDARAVGRVRPGRDRRARGRGRGHRRADAVAVRVRAPPAGRAAAGPAAGPRADREATTGRSPGWAPRTRCTPATSVAVPGRGRPADGGPRRRGGAPAGLPAHRRRAGPGPHPGRRRVLHRRARPPPCRRPRGRGDHRHSTPGSAPPRWPGTT